MLPDLPKFDPLSSGARLGETLTRICDRIRLQTLIGSKSVKITDTVKGTKVDRVGGVANSSTLALGFAVTNTGSSIDIAAGKVITPSWSGTSSTDFRPGNWTTETNFTGAVLSSSASAVWLQVAFTESDTTSEGLLGLTPIDLSGGAGGRGGGGGGGGASADEGAEDYYPNPGTIGDDGSVGGAGGAGGLVKDYTDDSTVTGLGAGVGAAGGAGGAGGDGGDGETITFTRATKGKVKVRYYTVGSISAHTTKGTASELSAWVKVATISGGDIVQHLAGTLRIAPAAPTFIEP